MTELTIALLRCKEAVRFCIKAVKISRTASKRFKPKPFDYILISLVKTRHDEIELQERDLFRFDWILCIYRFHTISPMDC